MITEEMVKMVYIAKRMGTEEQFNTLANDIWIRWGSYNGVHLPSFLLGSIDMSYSTIQAYLESPEMMLNALESNRNES